MGPCDGLEDFNTGVCGSCWAGIGYGRIGAVYWLRGGWAMAVFCMR